MSDYTEQYVRERCAQLEEALDRRDGELAVAIIETIRYDGHPDLADTILHGLIEQGLNNLVNGGVR
jgi:hypothetical protein